MKKLVYTWRTPSYSVISERNGAAVVTKAITSIITCAGVRLPVRVCTVAANQI